VTQGLQNVFVCDSFKGTNVAGNAERIFGKKFSECFMPSEEKFGT
jgi:hypothetical protein